MANENIAMRALSCFCFRRAKYTIPDDFHSHVAKRCWGEGEEGARDKGEGEYVTARYIQNVTSQFSPRSHCCRNASVFFVLDLSTIASK